MLDSFEQHWAEGMMNHRLPGRTKQDAFNLLVADLRGYLFSEKDVPLPTKQCESPFNQIKGCPP